jgi:hypothetical protein
MLFMVLFGFVVALFGILLFLLLVNSPLLTAKQKAQSTQK